jgi:predicted nicotinamide N-methyase
MIPKDDTNKFEISIYEPSLTGDSLGFKTWAASYLLSKRLHTMELPQSCDGQQLRILELGSGTGLVGMAAAAALGASVLLTDLPEIEGNLARNVLQNEAVITEHRGIAKTAILDWTNPNEIISSASSVSTTGSDIAAFVEAKIDKFPAIVAADSIYSAEHPTMLIEAIKTWLAPGPNARVIVELPRRNGYSAEIQDFRNCMLLLGLHILDEGEETGYDDWGGSTEDELQEVNCWWSVWSWATTS